VNDDDRQYAWIDLETTGSEPGQDQVLEVGIVLTRASFDPYQVRSWVAHYDIEDAQHASKVVFDMHTANGLWEAADESGWTIEEIDSQIDAWLRTTTASYPHRKVILCGSGVSHFDRRFIRRHLPQLDAWLTYYAIDVGVIRRFLRLAGIDVRDVGERKKHRAIDDALQHAAEARHYMGLIRIGWDAFKRRLEAPKEMSDDD
jgi:oligoribonuclease